MQTAPRRVHTIAYWLWANSFVFPFRLQRPTRLVFCDVGASGRRIEETARRNPFVRFAIEYMFDELDERPAPRVVEIKGFAAWNDKYIVVDDTVLALLHQSPDPAIDERSGCEWAPRNYEAIDAIPVGCGGPHDEPIGKRIRSRDLLCAAQNEPLFIVNVLRSSPRWIFNKDCERRNLCKTHFQAFRRRSRTVKNSGNVFDTHAGLRIRMPGAARPVTAKLMAIR